MIKKIFVILAAVGLMLPSFVFAADFGLKGASQGTGLIKAGSNVSENTIPELIGSIVAVALSFVGAIFFILILYAGFLWMTAFGSSEKVDKAKDILLHAVIGLIIVLAAYAISTFVFNALTGVSNAPAAPAEETGVLGCCYVESALACTPDLLQSECDTSSGLIWQEGSCPATCT